MRTVTSGLSALLLAVLLLASGAGAGAGARAAPEPATTILHLSATGAVQATPDLLVADLVAQETSPSAAKAQRTVNGRMASAMQAARAVADVDARAIGYSVAPSGDDKHPGWVAQQTLELRGSDAPSLLDLAGKLQQDGLEAASIDWQLSPALRDRAHDAATRAALGQVQARAASAAASLGLHVDHVRDVRLDSPVYASRPMPMMAMQARSPPPQASAAPQDVTAEVSAEYVLRR